MIKFVVIDGEEALGYVDSRQPSTLCIMAVSLKGSQYHNPLNPLTYYPRTVERPATRKDFDTFRVSPEGYSKDTTRYNFPLN